MEGFTSSVQGQELARRRRLLDAMTQQSQESPLVGESGPSQAILKMLTQVMLNRKNEGLSRDVQAGSEKYSADLGRESGEYIDRMNGKVGQQMSVPQVDALMSQDQAPQLADPVAANPREAIVKAMTSRLPEMQALGKAGMASQAKQPQQMSPLDLLKLDGFSPESRVKAALSGQIDGLTGKQSEHVINNQLVRSSGTGPAQPAGDFGPVYGEVGSVATGPEGKAIMGQKEISSNKVQFAPQGTSVNVDTQGSKIALTKLDGVLEKATTSVTNAQQAIEAADRVYKMSQDPQILAGFGGGVLQGFAAAAARLGLTGPDAAAKTQALVADLASSTLLRAKELTGVISDKDIQFLKDVTAGSIEKTPDVIRHIAGLAFATNHNAIQQAHRQYESAGSIAGGEDIKKLYPMPKVGYQSPDPDAFPVDSNGRMKYNSPLYQPKLPAKASNQPAGATMSGDDFLKKYFGGKQ